MGQLDKWGVEQFYPLVSGGVDWNLGTDDPDNKSGFNFNVKDGSNSASRKTQGSLVYWHIGDAGSSCRLDIRAVGGSQKYTWENGAIEHGHISDTGKDPKDLEMTGFFRISNVVDDTISYKIRGGTHTGNHDPRASCVGVMFPMSRGEDTCWEKELDHPDYEKSGVADSPGMDDDQWIGLKVISYNDGGWPAKNVINEMWYDPDPFDSGGKPQNNWKLYFKYIDNDGKDSYDQVCNWGGWVHTYRIDEIDDLDFALLSIRYINPKGTFGGGGGTGGGGGGTTDPGGDTVGTNLLTYSDSDITAIGQYGDGAPNLVNDGGNLDTHWAYKPVPGWIQVDLGALKRVDYLRIAWYKGNERVYNYKVELSEDNSAWSQVFQGATKGDGLDHERANFTDKDARYVKMTVTSNSVNDYASVTDLQIWGNNTPLSGGTPDPEPGGGSGGNPSEPDTAFKSWKIKYNINLYTDPQCNVDQSQF